jgi:hypothetical protein
VRPLLTLLLVTLVGCANRPAAPASRADAAAAPAPMHVLGDALVAAAPADAAPMVTGPDATPADPAVEQQAIADLVKLGDAFCACTTLDCAKALDARVTAVLGKYEKIGASAVVRNAAVEFQKRAAECVAKLRAAAGEERPPVAIMQRAADAVCACKDLPCVKTVLGALDTELAPFKNVKGSPEEQRKIMDASQRILNCRNKISDAEHEKQQR